MDGNDGKLKKEKKTGCGREEDNAAGDCRQVALAGTSPAASPAWVIVQADLVRTHLQTLDLLLPLGCSGTRSVYIDTNTAL